MTTPDAATLAGLGASIVRPPFLAYLDIVGDPVRATTWETGLSFTTSGDSDLDGHSFLAISSQLATVGPVKRQTGGSETVTAELSGIVGPDSDLLDLLGDETKWKGRLARLWYLLLDDSGAQIGGVVPYYTGRMVGFSIGGSSTQQRARITIESYLASLSAASRRTYLDQHDFDAADTSAALTIAVANGSRNGVAATSAGVSVSGDTYAGDYG